MVRRRNEEEQGRRQHMAWRNGEGGGTAAPAVGACEQVAAAWHRAMGTPCPGNAQGVLQHARAQTHGLLSCLHCSL